jgi:cell division septation protein DedD
MEDQQKRSVNWTWFGALAMIVIMVGTATYFMLPRLLPKAEDDIAIIKASDAPLKVRVAESKEQTVDHQDLLVVEILKNGDADDGQTETLRPGAASPEPPPVEDPKITADSKAEQTASKDPAPAVTEIAATQTPVPAKKNTEESAEKSKASQTALNTPRPTAASKAAPAPATATATATKKPPQPKSESKPVASISKRVIVIEGDAPLYMIQLAAFRNQKKADEIAIILSEKHKTRLGDATLETMRIDTTSNGTFHRVVSAPMPRKDADTLCSVLRRAGQDCFLRKYEPPKD